MNTSGYGAAPYPAKVVDWPSPLSPIRNANELASIAFRKGVARSNEGCVQMYFP
jgi:hypothetical protein